MGAWEWSECAISHAGVLLHLRDADDQCLCCGSVLGEDTFTAIPDFCVLALCQSLLEHNFGWKSCFQLKNNCASKVKMIKKGHDLLHDSMTLTASFAIICDDSWDFHALWKMIVLMWCPQTIHATWWTPMFFADHNCKMQWNCATFFQNDMWPMWMCRWHWSQKWLHTRNVQWGDSDVNFINFEETHCFVIQCSHFTMKCDIREQMMLWRSCGRWFLFFALVGSSLIGSQNQNWKTIKMLWQGCAEFSIVMHLWADDGLTFPWLGFEMA